MSEEKEESFIPEISDEKLMSLVKRIKPMMDRSDLGLEYINIRHWTAEDLRSKSFVWNKKNGGRVRRPLKLRESIKTYHTFGAPIFFKPSVAEVLAQLTEEQLEWCRGFVLEDQNLSAANVLYTGYHVTTTHLYGT